MSTKFGRRLKKVRHVCKNVLMPSLRDKKVGVVVDEISLIARVIDNFLYLNLVITLYWVKEDKLDKK